MPSPREEFVREASNRAQHAQGWHEDEGEGLLSDEDEVMHHMAGCEVCDRVRRQGNPLLQGIGVHDPVVDNSVRQKTD